MTNPESKLSKYQAAKELGKSRATIDNYVREGKLKLREQQGFKEKFIYRRDIDKLKLQLNEHNQ
jgi:predicted transcriptional regulator